MIETPKHLEELSSRRVYFGMDSGDLAEYCLWYRYKDQEIPLAAFGDVVYIYGREKSRKTLLKDCMIAGNYTDDEDLCLNFKMKLPEGSNILHVDCEQPLYQTLENHDRFRQMTHSSMDVPNYHYYNLRPYWYTQKMEQIKFLCEEVPNVKLLVIDQFVNLVKNENDDESIHEARFLLERLAEQYKLMILTLIHTNRGGRESNGKAGAILDKITAAAFRVEYTNETGISTVEHTWARKKRIPKFSFKHRRNADLPKLVDVYPDKNFI